MTRGFQFTGHQSYRKYLASPEWRKLRQKVMDRFDGICQLCGDKASEVHHTKYWGSVFLGHDETRLYPLCRTCHRKVEFDGSRKRSPREAEKLWKQLHSESLADTVETLKSHQGTTTQRMYRAGRDPALKNCEKVDGIK